jgi:lysozyme family protein
MADIGAAVRYVLKNEDRKLSGIVTKDGGGTTRFGVARKFHPNLDPAFYTCPVDKALAWAIQIYQDEYATPLHIAEFASQPVANKVLDLGINCGLKPAAGILQSAVVDLGQKIVIDKEIGSGTVAAVNAVKSDDLIQRLILRSINYYRLTAARLNSTPNELASWLARAEKPGI